MKNLTAKSVAGLLSYFDWAEYFDTKAIDVKKDCRHEDDDWERWTEVSIPFKPTTNGGPIPPKILERAKVIFENAWGGIVEAGIQVDDNGKAVLLFVI